MPWQRHKEALMNLTLSVLEITWQRHKEALMNLTLSVLEIIWHRHKEALMNLTLSVLEIIWQRHKEALMNLTLSVLEIICRCNKPLLNWDNEKRFLYFKFDFFLRNLHMCKIIPLRDTSATILGCCDRFGRGASLYRHRSQLFGRLWVRLPLPTGQFSEI